MSRFSLLGAALIASAGITFATSTTAEMMICTGLGCTSTPIAETAPGIIAVSGTIGNWTVTLVSGVTQSPVDNVTYGLDIGALTASCNTACATSPLVVTLSDINFTSSISDMEVSYSDTQTGVGSTSAEAYLDTHNVLFGETGGGVTHAGPVTLSGSGAVSATTAVNAGPSAYSLTLVDTFTATGPGAVNFSTDAQLIGVPEPGAIVLFGTMLLLCAVGLRRRLMN
jgi:hypothetical protein